MAGAAVTAATSTPAAAAVPKGKLVAGVPGATPAADPAVAAATAAAAAALASKWKKPFGTADLVIAVVMGTAFLFLSTVEFSFDHHIFGLIQTELLGGATGAAAGSKAIVPASHPLAQALGLFYSWRAGGAPVLRYWDVLMACIVPLAILGMVVELWESFVRRKRAPLIRHLLDVEALVHLIAMITITVTQAAPHQARLVAATEAARQSSSAAASTASADPAAPANEDVFYSIRALTNAHFLLFMLNLLQWFVPFWRVRLQRQQENMIAAEVRAAEKAEKDAAKAAEKAKQAATPSLADMEARMAQAEAVTAAAMAAMQPQQDGAEIRKRK
jgi:hypothetical protein